MTIMEIINQYDHSDLIRILYFPDNKIQVLQSHSIRHSDYYIMDTHPQGLQKGMEQVQQKYKKVDGG